MLSTLLPLPGLGQLTVVTSRDAAGHVTAVELVSLRTAAEIEADLDRARATLVWAEAEVQTCRGEIQRCRADVDIKDSFIDITSTELKLARSQRRDIERVGLERQRRIQDAEKKLLERVEDAVEARLKYAEESVLGAQATIAALELELELVNRNIELSVPDEPITSDWQGEALDDLRGRLLTAMRTSADRASRVDRERKKLVEAQMKVLDAQRELSERMSAPTG